MSGDRKDLRILHVNDCAFYAHRVLEDARTRGLPWGFYPRAVAGSQWGGLAGKLAYARQGLAWLGGLASRSLKVDLLHIHSGSMLHHTRFVPKKYVLTLHGTDIRTLQYDPRWQRSIHNGVRHAAAVMYTTPDLREHVIGLRPDAIYLPVPITLGSLPARQRDSSDKPWIFFVSRWDDSKGAVEQLATARELVRLSGGRYEVLGLDWGPYAITAAQSGVTLVPKMSHQEFLEFLAGCSAAVGQSSGLLGSSELEALGLGVPLYMPLAPGLYTNNPPVGWGRSSDPEGLAGCVAAELFNGSDLEARAAAGVGWIEKHHSTAATVDRLLDIYAQALQ
ncbi:hypothetical protein [Arthrobacter sp. NPDC057009]|uniref:hypothetical protein n=1 Tax=Arthrobacter sp. NPDC057009 TaxID=3345996 RepID=UPI00362C64DB